MIYTAIRTKLVWNNVTRRIERCYYRITVATNKRLISSVDKTASETVIDAYRTTRWTRLVDSRVALFFQRRTSSSWVHVIIIFYVLRKYTNLILRREYALSATCLHTHTFYSRNRTSYGHSSLSAAINHSHDVIVGRATRPSRRAADARRSSDRTRTIIRSFQPKRHCIGRLRPDARRYMFL